MKDTISDHLLIFDAYDCNDKDWQIVIKCLEKNLKNFNVLYADGNWMNFRWGTKNDYKRKGEK